MKPCDLPAVIARTKNDGTCMMFLMCNEAPTTLVDHAQLGPVSSCVSCAGWYEALSGAVRPLPSDPASASQ